MSKLGTIVRQVKPVQETYRINHAEKIQSLLSEGAISTADIFKRDNKEKFINKAIKGELVDTKGNKILAIKKNSDLITHLKTATNKSDELNSLIKQAFSKSLTALKIDKPANGFAGGRGGGKGPSGAEWEEVICAAYNMISNDVSQDEAVKQAGITEWKEKLSDFVPVGEDIVKNAFGTPSGVMKHYGQGQGKLTKKWDDYFIKMTGKSASTPTKTPKTDMILGKQNISLKKSGGSQLMSGGQSETLATLSFAYDAAPDTIKTQKFDAAWKKLNKNIEKQFVAFSLPKGKTTTDVSQENAKSELGNLVRDAMTKNKAMTDAIRDIMQAEEIKKEIVREAMTGKAKFADPKAASTHMMKFDAQGEGSFIAINESLVSKYTKNTTFNISFKSSGTGGRSWTALKGIFKEDYDILDNIISESIEETNNQFLEEGLLDLFKGAADKGKKITSNILGKLKKFLLLFLKKVWEKIKAVLLKGLDIAMNLLGKKIVVSGEGYSFRGGW